MKVFVIGAGQMGSGIAQVSAQAGYDTYMYDAVPAAMQKGMAYVEGNLARYVKKERITEERKAEVLSHLRTAESLEQAADCDLVIEAIIENMEIKSSVFRKLDAICKPETVFATNTSSLPITSIAAVTKRPEKVIGMHFMNPVPVMTLVEVIRGLETNQKTLDFVFNTSREMGKVPIEVRDVPGFISNRVLQVMINEAIYCVYEGVASPEGIDEIMKRGMGHPMGPLQLADFIGLDTILYVLEIMFEGYGDPKYRPCPLLRQYVAAGRFGKKSGRGFYEYN